MSDNKPTSYTIIEDPEIIPSENFAPSRPTFKVTATASADTSGEELAIDVVPTNASGNMLDSIFGSIGKAYSNSFWGSIGIVAAGTALIGFLIWESVHDGASTKTQSPVSVTSQPAATAAITSIKNDLSSTAARLSSLGYNQNTIQTTSNRILLTRGTDVALAASRLVSPTANARLSVTGPTPPTHYAGINQINVDAYFNSIENQNATANSAAVHGLTTEAAK